MKKIFYTNPYIKDFIAEILEIKEIENTYHIVLDKTAFFPGGGGQVCDIGMIGYQDVIDVYEKNSQIYHVVKSKPQNIHNVKCSINWERRKDGMQQHSAQHVLSGSFYKLFKANTSAVHFGVSTSTIDIQGDITEEQIKEAEAYANRIIEEKIEIETVIPSKQELESIWIRRDLPETNDEIRILQIKDLDSNACCGIHLTNTSDIRIIKLKRLEKNKGATRIEFLAGKRAVEYFTRRDSLLIDVCRYLSSTDEEVLEGIKTIHAKMEEIHTNNKKLEEVVSNYEIQEMINNSINIDNISIVKKLYKNENLKYVSRIVNRIIQRDNIVVLIGIENVDKANLIFASSKNFKKNNMNDILKESIKLIEGRGGGSLNLAQGGGVNNGNIEKALDDAFLNLKKSL